MARARVAARNLAARFERHADTLQHAEQRPRAEVLAALAEVERVAASDDRREVGHVSEAVRALILTLDTATDPRMLSAGIAAGDMANVMLASFGDWWPEEAARIDAVEFRVLAERWRRPARRVRGGGPTKWDQLASLLESACLCESSGAALKKLQQRTPRR